MKCIFHWREALGSGCRGAGKWRSSQPDSRPSGWASRQKLTRLTRVVPGCPAWSHVEFFLGRRGTGRAEPVPDMKISSKVQPKSNVQSSQGAGRRSSAFAGTAVADKGGDSSPRLLRVQGRGTRFLVSSEVYDFSPVTDIFHLFSRFFTPFFSHKGLVFRRLGKIPRYKRYRGQKMKFENKKTLGFIGKRASVESMNTEIFHANAANQPGSKRHNAWASRSNRPSPGFGGQTAPRSFGGG